MQFDNVYFWTDTIKDWKLLLKPYKYKRGSQSIVARIDREGIGHDLRLCDYAKPPARSIGDKRTEWQGNRNAARPHASFNKYTSHMVLKDLKASHPDVLPHFKVDDPERSHRIWQRDPLAVLMYNQK